MLKPQCKDHAQVTRPNAATMNLPNPRVRDRQDRQQQQEIDSDPLISNFFLVSLKVDLSFSLFFYSVVDSTPIEYSKERRKKTVTTGMPHQPISFFCLPDLPESFPTQANVHSLEREKDKTERGGNKTFIGDGGPRVRIRAGRGCHRP